MAPLNLSPVFFSKEDRGILHGSFPLTFISPGNTCRRLSLSELILIGDVIESESLTTWNRCTKQPNPYPQQPAARCSSLHAASYLFCILTMPIRFTLLKVKYRARRSSEILKPFTASTCKYGRLLRILGDNIARWSTIFSDLYPLFGKLNRMRNSLESIVRSGVAVNSVTSTWVWTFIVKLSVDQQSVLDVL